MSKNKTLRRLSSAAILSLAVYGTSVSPLIARQVNAFEGGTKIKQETMMKKKDTEKGIVLNKVKVESVGTNSLTVNDAKTTKTYSITLDDKTKIFRKFGGKGTLGEIKVGHEVQVVGKVSSADPMSVTAKVIRDLSIQKFLGSFVGEVTANDGSVVTLKTVKRGEIKVMVGTAKVTDRKGAALGVTDLMVGHKVMASGVWDKTEMTLSEVTKVIDMSLPAKTTK